MILILIFKTLDYTWDYISALQSMSHITKRYCGNGVQNKIQGESECRKTFKMARYEILPSKENIETEYCQTKWKICFSA